MYLKEYVVATIVLIKNNTPSLDDYLLIRLAVYIFHLIREYHGQNFTVVVQ